MPAPARNDPDFPNNLPSQPPRSAGAYASPTRGAKLRFAGDHHVAAPLGGPFRFHWSSAFGIAFCGTPCDCSALRVAKYCVSGTVDVTWYPFASYGGRKFSHRSPTLTVSSRVA